MKQNKETLKQFFETGDKPTQEQYSDLIDSYIDAKQPEGEANRRFVIDETGEVSVASEQQVPEYTLSPISGTNTVDLLKDGVSVSQIDLTPYLDNTNLARLVSGSVDANGLATFTRDDNSTFTVDLSNLKDTVPQYQAGINISIDNTDPLQPVINAAPRVNITEGVFTPSFFTTGSSFSVQQVKGEYYTIGDRVFVDMILSGVTSDGQATYGEVYIAPNIAGFPIGVSVSGTVYNIQAHENYGCYVRHDLGRVNIKDRVWDNETLYINFSYTSKEILS